MNRLSDLIRLAILKAEGEERDRLKKQEIAQKVTERKIHILDEMIKANININ